MNIVNGNRVLGVQGRTDYIKDGILYHGAPAEEVMIEDESQLAMLAGYPVGTTAYTAGYNGVWQKAADGTWVDIMEVGGNG